jgi:hypothetical protein
VEDFTCAAINLSKAKGGAYRKLGVNAVPTFIAYRDGERVDERQASDLAMMENFASTELLSDLPDCEDEEECTVDGSWFA